MSTAGEHAVARATDWGAGRSLAELRETIHALIGMMTEGGVTELDLAVGDVSIRLRGTGGVSAPAAILAPTSLESPLFVSPDGEEVVLAPDDHVVTAPMIGTFYGSPSPGEPPYVRIGDAVEVGQTIGIIEAMKIMNEIAADRAGVVADVFVSSGEAVEYGSPLLRLTAALDLPA